MPRLANRRECMQIDIPIHIKHLDRNPDFGFVRMFGPNPNDHTVVVVDVLASRPDVTIEFLARQVHGMTGRLVVTGPWLMGDRHSDAIADILAVADDAAKSGRKATAVELIAEALTQRRKLVSSSILRSLVIPVRQDWQVTVKLNDGAPPGPVDVWIRTLESRDVA